MENPKQSTISNIVNNIYTLLEKDDKNPIELALAPRSPNDLGFLPGPNRKNIEKQLKMLIIKAISTHESNSLKMLLAEEYRNQLYIISEVSILEYINDDEYDNLFNKTDNVIYKTLINMDPKRYNQCILEEILDHLTSSSYHFIDKIFIEINIIEERAKIIKEELMKLDNDDLEIIYDIFNANDEYKQLMYKFENDNKDKKITRQIINEAYQSTNIKIKTLYKQLLEDRFGVTSQIPRTKSSRNKQKNHPPK